MWAALAAKLKGYKTIIAARIGMGASLILGVRDVIAASGADITPLIPPKYLPWVMFASYVGFELLRRVTRTAVGEKE